MDKIRFLLASLLLVTVLAACDEHEKEYIDTRMYVGQIVLDNGRVVNLSDYDKETMKALGVIYAVDNDGSRFNGRAYAVLLKELTPKQFSDSLNLSLKTSTSMTDYKGFDNTFSMYDSGCSPLAVSVMYRLPYFQSAFIPSLQEMRLMYESKKVVNPILKELGGDGFPEDASECYYWTSTEVANHEGYQAYTYSMSGGQPLPAVKTMTYPARPVILLYD